MIVDCYSMFSFISPWAFICIELPNFIQIEPPRRAVMTSYRFFRVFTNSTRSKRSKSICPPNFDNPRLKYYYFPFWKINGLVGILLSVSILTYLSSSASYFASAHQLSYKWNQTPRDWTRLFVNKAERQTKTDYIQWN